MSEKQDTTSRDFVPRTAHSNGDSDPDYVSLHQAKTADLPDTEAELGPRATYFSTGAGAGLSQEHRDYLIARHGTLDLDPIPSDDPAE